MTLLTESQARATAREIVDQLAIIDTSSGPPCEIPLKATEVFHHVDEMVACVAAALSSATRAAEEQARRDAAVIEAAEEASDAFASEIRGEHAKQLSSALLGLRAALAARKEPGHE